MNSDKRPRPQLYLTATPLPVPAQLKLSISQVPQFFAAQWIESPSGYSSMDQADDITKIPQAQRGPQTTVQPSKR